MIIMKYDNPGQPPKPMHLKRVHRLSIGLDKATYEMFIKAYPTKKEQRQQLDLALLNCINKKNNEQNEWLDKLLI
jgi:hypothetical protein